MTAKMDRWRSYRFYRALRWLKSPVRYICEIFGDPRFSSFSTQSANRRHHSMIYARHLDYERLRGGGRNTVRFAAASNAVSPDKALLGLHKRIPEILLTTVALLHSAVLELRKCRSNCQSACKFDPVSASNFDPFERRVLTVALVSSELAGIAETRRARVA